MGVGDKMKDYASNIQDGAKSSAMSFAHISLRLITGFFLGMLTGLIAQELVGFGTFVLVFCVVVVMAVVLKVFSKWGMGQILIFDLICVLVAMLLRMYILVAP